MASKMLLARDASDIPIDIPAAQQKRYVKPLRCEFCDAQVSFVNGYTRYLGEDIVDVDPFFRLIKEQAHSDTCRYNVHGQIAIIARESDGDVLAAILGNRYELRLLAIKKTLEQLQLTVARQKADQDRPGTSTEKNYIETEGRLGAYINSAMRVLKVRAVCEENIDIESVLVLAFDGVRVSWADFYFDDSDLFRCHAQLLRASVLMPVAVCGTVKAVKQVNGRTGNFAVLELMRPTRVPENAEVRDVACASVWSADLTSFEAFKPNQKIVAFGMWEAKSPNTVQNPRADSTIKTFRNCDLKLWLVTRSQICRA
jgi:hypothetical protein